MGVLLRLLSARVDLNKSTADAGLKWARTRCMTHHDTENWPNVSQCCSMLWQPGFLLMGMAQVVLAMSRPIQSSEQKYGKRMILRMA